MAPSEPKPRLVRCRSCSGPIWWGETKAGKRCPFDYDLVTGQPTQVSHFTTCPQASRWTRPRHAAPAGADGGKGPLPW